jgi:hypothetical protein
MRRLPKRGASLLTPSRSEGDLKVALCDLGVANLDDAAIHDLYFGIAQICGSWFSEQETAEVSPVSKALQSTGKGLLEASQLFSGHETGLRTHVEIEATSQVAEILALDTSVGSLREAKALISRFQEEAAKIGHACMVAYADLNRQGVNEGRTPLRWYDEFTALLLDVADRVGVEPAVGKDRITGARTGWLFEAAQALEPFIFKFMRSPSAEACAKRLERSKKRLARVKRQNPPAK